MLIIPVGGGSSNDESVGLNEEHQGPDQVDNVEGEKYFHETCYVEMLEGILVLAGGRSAQGVETYDLEEPED